MWKKIQNPQQDAIFQVSWNFFSFVQGLFLHLISLCLVLYIWFVMYFFLLFNFCWKVFTSITGASPYSWEIVDQEGKNTPNTPQYSRNLF